MIIMLLVPLPLMNVMMTMEMMMIMNLVRKVLLLLPL